MRTGEEKSLFVTCFIIEIEEEFERQPSGEWIFAQVCAVAFFVFYVAVFVSKPGSEVGVKVKLPYLGSGAPSIWNG